MDKKKESPLTIKFKDFYQDVNGVTFFKILVYDRETANSWEFDERYSIMRDIHKTLREQYKGELPDFPTKKWFGNTDKNFLSQRKATLQTYFTNILNHLDIQKYPILRNFFYKNAPKADGQQQDMNGGNKTNVPKTGDPPKGDNKVQKNENQQQNNHQAGNIISEKQKQEMKAKEFAQQMIKINEKIQNKFITNLIDFGVLQDEGVQEQKKSSINKNQFNLKSNLLSSLSLPQKSVEKPDLNLQDNINHSKILKSMDNLASKLISTYEQNIKSYNQLSSEIIAGKENNFSNSD